MKRKVRCVNLDTNVEWELFEEDFNCLKRNFKFIEWVYNEEPKKAEPVALTDIHQMNKVALLEEAQSLGLQVSNKMTVGKIKEAILDHKNSIDEF